MRLWALVPFRALSVFLLSAPLSSHLLNSASSSPIMSSLQNFCIFHLGRSPITIRPLLKNLFIFHLGKSSITIRPFLKNLCSFHLGRSPIIMKPFLKNLCIFPFWQVTHYNETFLKNCYHLGKSITIRPLWKKNLCIFHHFEKSLYFSPGYVTDYNETTLKTLFHLSMGRSPMTIWPFQNSLNFTNRQVVWYNFTTLKEKSSSFSSEWAFQPSFQNTFRKIHYFLIWWVPYLSFFFSLQSLLSKVSYETFYRKHCKEGTTITTHCWVILQIHLSFFFQNKIPTK